jgi:hypothetical protein
MASVNAQRCSPHCFKSCHIHKFLNKETMGCFEPPSTDDGFYSSKIDCDIYLEWLYLHEGRPPFQRHSFFAKAAQITKDGPKGLGQLSKIHSEICQ